MVVNNGKVGIGTTAPSNQLTIESGTTGESISDGLRLQNSHGVNNDISPIYFGVHGGTRRAKCGIGWERTGSYGIGKLLFALDNTSDDADVSFANDTKVTFQGDGKVGIGVDSPGGVSKLEVQRPARTTAFNAADGDTWHDLIVRNPTNSSNAASGIAFLMNNTYHKNAGAGIVAISGGSDYTASLAFVTRPYGAVAEERMRIASDGNVGIGTTSPGAQLHVRGSDGYLKFDTSGADGTIKSDYNLKLYADDNNNNSSTYQNIQFFTAGANERLRIDSAGDAIFYKSAYTQNANGYKILLGKGTRWGYSSAYKAIQIGDASGNYTVCIGYDPSGNTNGSFTGDGGELLFRNNMTFMTPNAADTGWHPCMHFQDGNVKIGSGAAGYKLDVGGTFRATGTGTFDSTLSVTGALTGTSATFSGLVELSAGARLLANTALLAQTSGSTSTQLIFWNGNTAYYGRNSGISPNTGTIAGHEFRVSGNTKLKVNSSGTTLTAPLTGTSATFSGVVTASLGLNIANNQRLSIGTAGSNTGYIRFWNNNSTAYYLDWESTAARAYRYHGTSSGSAYVTTFSQAGSGGHNVTVAGNINLAALPSTTVNAAVPILFRPTEGTLSGDTALTWNPAADSLDVNGTVITQNHIRSTHAYGNGELKLGSANGGVVLELTAAGNATFSGALTGTSATFSGDISMGGDMTIGGDSAAIAKKQEINLSGLSQSNFYPVVMSGSPSYEGTVQFTLGMWSQIGSDPYNNNMVVGWARAQGWSDMVYGYDLSFNCYTDTERTILGIYRGTQSSNRVIFYLRGGEKYYFTTANQATAYTVAGSMYNEGTTSTSLTVAMIKDSTGADIASQADASQNLSRMVDLFSGKQGTYSSGTYYNNNIAFQGTSAHEGAATFSSTLGVTGALTGTSATFSGALGVTGAITASSMTNTLGSAVANNNLQTKLNGVASKANRIHFQEGGVDKWLLGQGAASETSAFELYNAAGVLAISVNKTSNLTTLGAGLVVSGTLKADTAITLRDGSGANVGALTVLGGNNLTICGSQANHCGLSFATNAILPATAGATNTGTVDLGASSEKFKDFYLSGAANIGGALTGTTATFSGPITTTANSGGRSSIWKAYSSGYGVNIYQTNAGVDKWNIGLNSSNQFYIYNYAASEVALLFDTSSNATFSGALTAGGNITTGGQILTPGGSNLALNPNTGLVTVGGALQATGALSGTTAAFTATGAADVDILTLDNNRNTVSDQWGIKFQDSFRTRARIQAINANAGNASAHLAFEIGYSTDTVERMRLNNMGNLGIGTTVPAATLHVRDTTASTSRWTAAFVADNAAIVSAQTHDHVLIQSNDVPSLKLYEYGQDQVGGIAVGDNNTTIASTETLRFYVNGSATGNIYDGMGGTVALILNTNGTSNFYGSVTLANDKILAIGTGAGNAGSIRIFDNSSTSRFMEWEPVGTSDAYFRFNGGTSYTSPYRTYFNQQHPTAGHNVYVDGDITSMGTGRYIYAVNLNVTGYKNFEIEHPTKEDMMLVHSSLEGPEAAVYHRGRTQSDTITMPDYWSGLVREDTITVQLTPNGSFQHLYVVSTSLSEIKIGAAEGETIDCYYIIYGERADVAPLVVEDAAAWERFQERKSAMSDGKV